MKREHLIPILFLAFLFIFTGCGDSAQETEAPKSEEQNDLVIELNISAASSLTEALTEIQKEYIKESDNVLLFNFGASGTLQTQIEQGAPCDLFFSASKANMDALEESGLIDAESRIDLLGNELTLIASAEKEGEIKSYESLGSSEIERISIGTPELVPAGKYAQESLESLGIWDEVQSKIIYGKDVKQVLEYVETGNVDCGIVYRSDTLNLKSGAVIMNLPEESHGKIVYPVALTHGAGQNEAALKFYDFLQTDYAKGVFEKYGFTVL